MLYVVLHVYNIYVELGRKITSSLFFLQLTIYTIHKLKLLCCHNALSIIKCCYDMTSLLVTCNCSDATTLPPTLLQNDCFTFLQHSCMRRRRRRRRRKGSGRTMHQCCCNITWTCPSGCVEKLLELFRR